ncbi:glutamine--fructose-6-phosphate transaminase [Sphingomonas sp. PP-F2F-A104-K0414]|uniref:SIS domain-containing protein n=1 Tax=Sphingomonas sp. PP-F2F-A104-K0414 TaxID=2135661 RepID=UPI00104EA275|nr:SIS domain-containing protein [Sphingomonas sp. PP-F2F-A104-K0414]TCP96755.1 glutamine--fructose-6-phosphate transaminase [Sphingomonas sp. PP-F2F-A104-K0414]
MTDPVESTTAMFVEAREAGAAVTRLLAANRATIAALATTLRATRVRLVVTCARGSSDHAASYGKYLFETMLALPVVSAAPSIASLFGAPAGGGADTLCIAISQSGRSPDLLATVGAWQRAGAHVVALVNDEESPLAALADTVIALSAGPECSVAATKSCIAAMAGLAAIVAAIADDPALADAVEALPAQLEKAFEQDWRALSIALVSATSLFVVGRGYGFGIAQEMALKLKETCALHAEAFSAAEVRHGPMTIVGPGFPILAIAGSDVSGESVRAVAEDFAERGARVLLADSTGGGALPAAKTHPAIEPILMLQSFYRAATALSLARGLNPDAPPHLAKVTQTV